MHPNRTRETSQLEADLRAEWRFKSEVVYLDHGAFGGSPSTIMDAQEEIRRSVELNPRQFFEAHFPASVEHAKRSLARFLCADVGGLVLTSGATSALNAVIQNRRFNAH